MQKLSLLLFLLFAANNLFAQQDHKHGSPHGGEVKSAGPDYHIETLIKGNLLTVYLLNANEKTLTVKGATATATIQTTDGKIIKAPLKTLGNNSFTYKLNPALKYNKAIITIQTGGKTASASFDLNKKAPGKSQQKTKPHKH